MRREQWAARRAAAIRSRARRSIRRTGATSARLAIACSMTCSTTPPTSGIVRYGSRYLMKFAPGFAPSCRARLFRSRRRLSGVLRFHRSLCDRQRSSRLHGMGAWRRHAGRDAGGNAGGWIERQSRRARSHSDRSRTSDRRMDAAALRFPERSKRHFRHGHLDGQSDGGAGGAHNGARTIRDGATASATKARC